MAVCGLAIAAGVLGVLAIAKRIMFRRRFGHGGYGPWAMASCGPGWGAGYGSGYDGGSPWGGPRGFRRGFGRGPGGSFWLRALFSRLDTTPGQEREIRSAIEELQRTGWALKDGLRGTRDEIARAVGGDVFDDGAIADASARADATTAQLKVAFADALRKTHAVLDGKQRERLAEILTKGPGWWRGGRGRGDGPETGSPYRDVL